MTDWKLHINADPAILFGKPVIRGTRIPVDLILERLGQGDTIESLQEGYPTLHKDDILACLLFAADNAKHECVLAA